MEARSGNAIKTKVNLTFVFALKSSHVSITVLNLCKTVINNGKKLRKCQEAIRECPERDK